MSKEEKGKCTLSDSVLIEVSNDWVSKLARSGGKAWCLRVPVDFNNDPDMLFVELGIRLAVRNTQLTAYKEALREIVELTDEMENAKTDIEYNIASVARKDIITKAKTLIE